MKRTWLFAILSALFLVTSVLLIYMGFFDRFFGNRSESYPPVLSATSSHQEDWASYLTTVNYDKVGSIMVDLGLKSFVPVSGRPNRLRVDVAMNYPSENGLPLQQEFDSLNDIDEKLAGSLTNKIDAVYAGHLYCQGTMSLYYYIDEKAAFESPLKEAMSAFPGYTYEIKVDRDAEWKDYTDFLYPAPIQMQGIQNQKTVMHLITSGDKLEMRRPVDHLIYFKNEVDIETFLGAIKGKGFEVVNKAKTDVGEHHWTLLLRRDDLVDLKSVDEYTLFLWQKAQDAHGDYDGWESSIVKE
jgi:uncharacterized protein (TIGR01619 family)